MKWVVIVRGAPHPDAVEMLPKVDGKPEVMHYLEDDWYVFARSDCTLDITTECKLAMHIGWATVYVRAMA